MTPPVLCLAFLASMYFRSYFGVVGPALSRDLFLTPQDFGWLASAFFTSFSLLQIPVGLAFDRWGVRLPMATMMALGALGSALVAFSSDFWTAMIGQGLIGVGCAPIFMGVLYFVGNTYDAERAGRLAAIVSAVGSTGALLSAAPLTMFTRGFGWRSACWLAALVMFACAIVIAFQLRSPGRFVKRPELEGGSGRFLPLLYLAPVCLTLSLGGVFRNAWAGPYVAGVFKGTSDLGALLTLVSMVGIATSFLVPALLFRLRPRTVVAATYVLGIICAATLAVHPGWNIFAAYAGLSVLYAMGNVHPLVMAEAQSLIPPSYRGIVLGALNTLVFFGVSAASSAFGQIAGMAFAPENTYRAVFLLTTASLIAALVIYLVFQPSSESCSRRTDVSH